MEHNIGESIKIARKMRGFTQSELGKKINIGKDHISRIETNQTNASMETMKKISKALQIPIAYILLLGINEKSFPKKYRYRFTIAQETINQIVKEIYN